jgi:hypothetical protein
MKFWLIVFFFSSNGTFVGKKEIPTATRAQCVEMSGQVAKRYVNSQRQLQFYCVTDAHHSGRSVDKGIPLD